MYNTLVQELQFFLKPKFFFLKPQISKYDLSPPQVDVMQLIIANQ